MVTTLLIWFNVLVVVVVCEGGLIWNIKSFWSKENFLKQKEKILPKKESNYKIGKDVGFDLWGMEINKWKWKISLLWEKESKKKNCAERNMAVDKVCLVCNKACKERNLVNLEKGGMILTRMSMRRMPPSWTSC